MKKDQIYDKEACDRAYQASCAADVNCYQDCAMPCPYDKQSPCDMCSISNCDETDCKAYAIYNKKRGITVQDIYEDKHEAVIIGDTTGPYLTCEYTVREKRFNPHYDPKKICKCGHPYTKHFDPYEDNEARGCKYCGCCEFVEAEEIRKEKTEDSV